MSEPLKAIEAGFQALEHLGFRIPLDSGKASAIAVQLQTRVSADPEVISVSDRREVCVLKS